MPHLKIIRRCLEGKPRSTCSASGAEEKRALAGHFIERVTAYRDYINVGLVYDEFEKKGKRGAQKSGPDRTPGPP